jgi:hypothetical protein
MTFLSLLSLFCGDADDAHRTWTNMHANHRCDFFRPDFTGPIVIF